MQLTRKISYLWYFILCLLLVLWSIVEIAHYKRLGVDVSVFIGCARQLLAGHRMYIEIFEINSPLISYLSIFPLFLSSSTHLALCKSLVVSVIAVASTSICLCAILTWKSQENWYWLGPMLAGLILVITYWFGAELGQREELFVFLYLPYFFTRAFRIHSVGVEPLPAIGAGILAGVGTLLKPHFLLPVVAIEFAFYFQFARAFKSDSMIKRPEAIAFCTTAVLLMVMLLISISSAKPNDLERQIFDLLVYSYTSPVSLLDLLTIRSVKNAFVATIVTTAIAVLFLRHHRLVAPLIVWIVATYFMYLLQAKGWRYHLLPLMCGVAMMWGLMIYLGLQRCCASENISRLFAGGKAIVEPAELLGKTYGFVQLVMIACISVACSIGGRHLLESRTAATIEKDLIPVDNWLATYTHPGDTIAVISPDGRRLENLLLSHDLKAGWRYSWGYPIKFLLREEGKPDTSNRRAVIDQKWRDILKTVDEDVHTRKPQLILLDHRLSDKLKDLGLERSILGGFEFKSSCSILDSNHVKVIDYDLYVRSSDR